MSNTVIKSQQGYISTTYQKNNHSSKAIVLMAHGAGAGNRHEFMDAYCFALADKGLKVISFNFDYMQTMYQTEKRRPPNSNKQLVVQFTKQIESVETKLPIFIAGKSMGGRVASQLAADEIISKRLAGCIVLGYPFMPPGKPEKITDRTAHFSHLQIPLLINQGERDTFGSSVTLGTEEHKAMLSASFVELNWIPSGDHSFKPLKSSAASLEDNIKLAVNNSYNFIKRLI